jgi:hypothetical protein
MQNRYDYTERSLELADQLLSIACELREHLQVHQADMHAISGRRRLGLLPGGRRALEHDHDAADLGGARLEDQFDSLEA